MQSHRVHSQVFLIIAVFSTSPAIHGCRELSLFDRDVEAKLSTLSEEKAIEFIRPFQLTSLECVKEIRLLAVYDSTNVGLYLRLQLDLAELSQFIRKSWLASQGKEDKTNLRWYQFNSVDDCERTWWHPPPIQSADSLFYKDPVTKDGYILGILKRNKEYADLYCYLDMLRKDFDEQILSLIKREGVHLAGGRDQVYEIWWKKDALKEDGEQIEGTTASKPSKPETGVND